MSDIFREVDEALQREKAAKLWKEYGPTLVLAAIVMVGATGITTAYRAWSSHSNQQATAKLIIAAEDKDMAAAMEKAAEDSGDNHGAIALMGAASRHADQKEFARAADLYGRVAADGSAPRALRDAAALYEIRSLQMAGGDKPLDYKTLAARAEAIAKDEKSPFRLLAKLDAALLYGDGLKDYTKALELLKGFEEGASGDSLAEKANALKHVYEFESSLTGAPAPKVSQ